MVSQIPFNNSQMLKAPQHAVAAAGHSFPAFCRIWISPLAVCVEELPASKGSPANTIVSVTRASVRDAPHLGMRGLGLLLVT